MIVIIRIVASGRGITRSRTGAGRNLNDGPRSVPLGSGAQLITIFQRGGGACEIDILIMRGFQMWPYPALCGSMRSQPQPTCPYAALSQPRGLRRGPGRRAFGGRRRGRGRCRRRRPDVGARREALAGARPPGIRARSRAGLESRHEAGDESWPILWPSLRCAAPVKANVRWEPYAAIFASLP